MIPLAAVLLGLSATFVTVALWPRPRDQEAVRFVEDERVPRTLH